MMIGEINRLRGFALPAVLVVSVLILLLILFAYSAITMNMHRYALYHEKKQLREDLKSTLVLYCADSTLCEVNDSSEVDLFAGHDKVKVSVERCGLYERVRLSNDYPDEYHVLVGRRNESDSKAAFWLCDRNRALSLAGDARIEGLVYMPLNGINYTEVNMRYYTGEPIPEERLSISSKDLPSIDSIQFEHARKLCRQNDKKVELSSPVRDTVISGSVVKIRKGFKGSLQVFASDSVIVEEGVVMEYPSGIYVDSGERRPYVSLERGSKVNGYIIVTSQNSDSQLRHPSYVHKSGATINGLLYVDGSCNIEGDIIGAAYVKDCYYYSNGNVYAGTLYDAKVVRSDSLAFPIFLKGPYERKMIKKLH